MVRSTTIRMPPIARKSPSLVFPHRAQTAALLRPPPPFSLPSLGSPHRPRTSVVARDRRSTTACERRDATPRPRIRQMELFGKARQYVDVLNEVFSRLLTVVSGDLLNQRRGHGGRYGLTCRLPEALRAIAITDPETSRCRSCGVFSLARCPQRRKSNLRFLVVFF